MKPNHKQIIAAFFGACFFTMIILCAKYLYLNWPGPGERGYEEIQTVLALREGQTVGLAFVGFLAGLSVLVLVRMKNRKGQSEYAGRDR